MDQNYKHQYRLLRDEFYESRGQIGSDSISTMNGTFGDALLLRRSANGSVSTWPGESGSTDHQATSMSVITTPASIPSPSPSVNEVSAKMASIPVRGMSASSKMGLADEEHSISNAVTTPSRALEPSRPRIGHKKSRAGCFNCKKRKIKCQENQPACHNCMRKNVRCVYPAPRTMAALRDSALYSSSPVASVSLQPTPQVFTLTDMRLFHHFLLDAYPHLPVGNDSAWVSHIPLIAHHNEYLMHAILALSASHLQMVTHAPLGATAMYHRTLAIRGTNEHMSMVNRTGSDGDALIASCYLLTFQSTYMDDGIYEFFLFVRGCSLVAKQLKAEKLPLAFLLQEEAHFDFMHERLRGLPIISPELVDGAEKSLLAVPAHFNLPVHPKAWDLLIRCVHGVRSSSLHGYFTFITIYTGIINFNPDEFQEFAGSNNQVSRIIIAHFLAIQMMLFPILDREWSRRSKLTPARMNITWIFSIWEDTSLSLRHLLDWPKAIMEAVQDELNGKGDIIPRIEVLRKREGLSKNIV